MFNKPVWPAALRSHRLNAAEKKGKVDKQSDGKSQARETKRVDPFILLCESRAPPSPFSFSLSHTHLKTPSCYCSHRHQDALDREDILFTTQSSRG